jgi:uncharacterized protein with FMN-binding domain
VKNMKKLSTYVLAMAFTLALIGCNAKTNPEINDNNSPNNSGTNLQKEITNSTANNDEKNAPGNNTANNPQQEITNSTAIKDEDNAPGSNTGTASGYIDGVYGSQYKNPTYGFEEAIVTIQGGKIKNVELKKLDDNKKEVNYDEWDGTKEGYPNLKQYRVDLAEAMINKQSPNVDVIAGAVESSNGWKAAVTDALSKAQ